MGIGWWAVTGGQCEVGFGRWGGGEWWKVGSGIWVVGGGW